MSVTETNNRNVALHSQKCIKTQEESETSFLTRRQKSLHVHRKEMPEQHSDYRVVVFGAASVGKTALIQRFINGTFKNSYTPTVEDTYRQVISSDKQVCALQITDTSGTHSFPAMKRLSIEKGHAFILVYAVTSRSTIEECKNIYMEIKQIKGSLGIDTANIPMMLVGNKVDESNREITERLATEVAKKWGCTYIETSAKTDLNVQEMFQELLTLDKSRAMSLNTSGKDKKKFSKKQNVKDNNKKDSNKTGASTSTSSKNDSNKKQQKNKETDKNKNDTSNKKKSDKKEKDSTSTDDKKCSLM